MVRNYKRKTTKGDYAKEKLLEAAQAVKTGKLSGYKAAQVYNIPRMTIMDRVNKTFKSSTIGRSTALSPEVEQNLASTLHLMERYGFGLSRQEVLEMVGDYVNKNELSTSFRNGIPGKDWFVSFKNRHNLSVKKPQGVEFARKKAVDPFIVYPYFSLLKKTIDELGLRDNPSAIWNLDETSFSKDPEKTKVVGIKGHAATRLISSPGKDNTTVLLGANGVGEKTPPLIIFKGKNMWDEWASPDAYPNTAYAATKNGWMETEVFENFFKKTFLNTVGKQRPILLIYDGHSTHVGLNIIEEARKENITILKLPPHTSHILQPLDIAVMKSFKDKWDPLLVKWQRLNVGSTLPKKEFSRLIGQVWEQIDPAVLCNGFRKAGIYPLNSYAIAENCFDVLKLKRWKEMHSNQQTGEQARNEPHHFCVTSDLYNSISSQVPKTTSQPLTLKSLALKTFVASKNSMQQSLMTNYTLPTSIEPNAAPSQPSKIRILENRSVTFEELLLMKVQAGRTLIQKRKKISHGAEVITHDDVLRRKIEENKKNIKQENKKNIKQENKKVKPNEKIKENQIKKDKKQEKPKLRKTKPRTRRAYEKHESSSSSDSDRSMPTYEDESEYEINATTLSSSDDETDKENTNKNCGPEILLPNTENKLPIVNDWLIVKFATKKSIKHYVGIVTQIDSGKNPVVKYLRKYKQRDNGTVFKFPHIEDVSVVGQLEDIVCFLPQPVQERRGLIYFDCLFHTYNLQ